MLKLFKILKMVKVLKVVRTFRSVRLLRFSRTVVPYGVKWLNNKACILQFNPFRIFHDISLKRESILRKSICEIISSLTRSWEKIITKSCKISLLFKNSSQWNIQNIWWSLPSRAPPSYKLFKFLLTFSGSLNFGHQFAQLFESSLTAGMAWSNQSGSQMRSGYILRSMKFPSHEFKRNSLLF